ncbi:MAG: rod shape-determining protein RodA [Bacteroidales bacterium]|jgi:rod shape determining protein RodA|nr:rod shape-determining protein RodA [Bacteroidales bacterium]
MGRTSSIRSKKGYDVYLIIYYVLLVVIGWFAIYSSAYDKSVTASIFDIGKPYGRQMIWIGVSLLELIVILSIDRKIFYNIAYYLYGLFLIVMVVVIVVGTEISGAQAWIKIGSFTFQPVEFMKWVTALALAKYFSEGKTKRQKQQVWISASVFIIIPIILTLLQRDTGSALVFFSFIFLFFREGLSARALILIIAIAFISIFTLLFNELYAIALLVTTFLVFWFLHRKDNKKIKRDFLILMGAICFVFAVNFIYSNVFQAHQKQRIDTILGKSSDPKGADFNLNQSLISIGSGGFWGKGYLNSTQTQLNFVPEKSTDFIFCTIAEEFGFLGSFVICLLFMLLISRIIIMSEKHFNPFVRYYGYGVAGIFFFHFAINIGMTIGLLPIIGIPLPFISYGGTSMLSFSAMLFVFIKLNGSE